MNPSDIANIEAIVCATILERPDLLDTITLTYKDFEDPSYSLIYRTIEWIVSKGAIPNYALVIEKLAKRNDIDISLLAESVNALYAQPWAIEQNVHIIRERTARKKMRHFASKLLEMSDSGLEMDEVVAEVESSWSDILQSADDSNSEVKSIAELVAEHENVMNERIKANKAKNYPGASTGFLSLNKFTNGFKPAHFYVIAARPSMGKTALSLQMSTGSAENDYAIVFSIEMDKMTLIDRLVAANSDLPMENIMVGQVKGDDYGRYSQALNTLRSKHLYIDDNSKTSVQYLRSRVRRVSRHVPEGKKLVVFVDYLQIMQASKGRSRHEEVANISQELKQLAKDCNCAVVALSQLNRNVEQQSDKRPTLADIRESGQIEQDADVVMLLYRDDYYNKETKEPNVLEVIVAKNRNGKTGTAKLTFLRQFQKIEDPSEMGR